MKLPSLFLAVLLEVTAQGAPPQPANSPSPPAAQPASKPITAFHVSTNAIALTFDDGPHPKNTPKLLDILKEKGVKATFFLMGEQVVRFPEIAKRIAAEGHEIGNDTWNHQSLRKLPEARVFEELQKTQDAIFAACGVTTRVYRPPFGAITTNMQKSIAEHFHYPAINWEVDTQDWKKPLTAAKVHDITLKETHAGSIILCHDIHETTVEAMPSTLDDLKAKGFKFLTISEMIQLEAEDAQKPDAARPTAPASTPPPVPPGPGKTAKP